MGEHLLQATAVEPIPFTLRAGVGKIEDRQVYYCIFQSKNQYNY